MKIAFMIPTFYPETGGAQSNCLYLAKELAKKHDVSVFCSTKSEDEEETYEKIKIYRCKDIGGYRYYMRLFPTLKKILDYEFDIVHVHGFGFIQQDKIVRKISKKYPNTKLMCTPHGPFMAKKNYGIVGNSFKIVYEPFVRNTIKLYNVIIQVNPYQYKWMEKTYDVLPEKIRLIPNGIPKDSFDKLDKKYVDEISTKYNLDGKLVITYIGRIQDYKGLDQVIKVLPKLPENVIFVAIGKDSGQQEMLKDLAATLDVKDRVIFTGFVGEKEKRALLDISEIFVLPSEWEAFGIGIVEAMARQNAIVSSRSEGGLYLVGEDNGNLYNYKNIDDLEKSLSDLVNNKSKRYQLKRNNFKKAKLFIWEKIVKELDKLYKEK
jgi:glycosyltransferase involved in cell wall biosynthesis